MTREEFLALRPGDVICEKQHNGYPRVVLARVDCQGRVRTKAMPRADSYGRQISTRATYVTAHQRYRIALKKDQDDA